MQKRTKFQIRSDASKQRWVRDDKKEAFWRKHVAEWKARGVSKRGYAIANNLSESSFNAWCREIELRDRERIQTANAAAILASDPIEPRSGFVALHVVSDANSNTNLSDENCKASCPDDSAATTIELMVPGGSVIRVAHDSDFTLIRRLLNVLEAK
jgi:hypothetical protein